MDGGAGNDIYRYLATALKTNDVGAGQSDSIAATAGDAIDFAAGLEKLLKINGTALSALTADQALGAAFGAGTNIRFAGGRLQIDLNADQAFAAGSDFEIAITGATSLVYAAAQDWLVCV